MTQAERDAALDRLAALMAASPLTVADIAFMLSRSQGFRLAGTHKHSEKGHLMMSAVKERVELEDDRRPQAIELEKDGVPDHVEALRQSLIERGVTPSDLVHKLGIGWATASRFLAGTKGLRNDTISRMLAEFGYRLVPTTPAAATAAIPNFLPEEFVERTRQEAIAESEEHVRELLKSARLEFTAPLSLSDGSRHRVRLSLDKVDLYAGEEKDGK